MDKPIYLDYCATTPCDPRVVEKMLPFFTERFGNAASADHSYGWDAKEAVDEARGKVARLINAKSHEITFTSGATEAINLALKGIIEAGERNHIITNKTEHKAVLDTVEYLASKGCEVTYLKVDESGTFSLDDLEAAITDRTAVVAVQYANNETGVIHKIREIGEIARRYGVLLFTDATQAVGKIPVDVIADNIDMLSLSAHKIYGPKGIGVLYVSSRSKIDLAIQQHGGNHERGKRSGTLNTPAIVGLGEAAAIAQKEMSNEGTRLEKLRDRLETELLNSIAGTKINGTATRLPQVANLLFPGIDAEQFLLTNSAQLALSRGSACSSAVKQPSHVLYAMGLSDLDAQNCIRFSLGRFTTQEEIDNTIDLLITALRS